MERNIRASLITGKDHGSTPRVLLVENDSAIRELLTELCFLERFGIATYPSISQGLSALNDNIRPYSNELPFTLFLSDLFGISEDIDQLQIVTPVNDLYRGVGRSWRLPVIALTACDPKIAEQIQNTGEIDGFMRKPFELDKLAKLIRSESLQEISIPQLPSRVTKSNCILT